MVFVMYSMVQGKKENKKLKKTTEINKLCRQTSFVGVPPLFGHFEPDFGCKSDSDDI